MDQSKTTPINKAPIRNYSTILLDESNSSIDKISLGDKVKKLTREPTRMNCPKCNNQIVTKTNLVRGQLTYLVCVLCVLGCWCGLLPLIIDNFKDIEHNCPKCQVLIGKHILDIGSIPQMDEL